MEPQYEENELDPRFLGTVVNLNSYAGHDSASRLQMFCSHMTQNLVVRGANPKRVQSGTEDDYGNYTFKTEMPCDGTILKVIMKYPPGIGAGSFKEGQSPGYGVLFEHSDGTLDILEIERYCSKHMTFGFKYVMNHNALNMLSEGAHIPAGTVFAHSPNLKPDGTYCYGVDTKVVFLSTPEGIEDGFAVRRGYLDSLGVQKIDSRVGEWGNEWYPLNLYGDENEYRPHPEIGQRIRDDGLVMVLRRKDKFSMFNEITPSDLLPDKIDEDYDRCIYGEAGAIVYDVTTFTDYKRRLPETPMGMDTQSTKYAKGLEDYYGAIQKFYHSRARARGGAENLRLTPELHRIVTMSYGMVRDKNKQNDPLARVDRQYRRRKLDNWRVEVKYAVEIIPTLGYKTSDGHGAKGVFVSIKEDEDMPRDQWGNVADIVMDSNSVIKRLNLGQLFEHYLGASALMMERHLSEKLAQGIPVKDRWEYLLGWYKIVSPYMYAVILKSVENGSITPEDHLQTCVDSGICVWVPSNSPNLGPGQVSKVRGGLEAHYPLERGSLTYRGANGKEFHTVEDIEIGTKYMILLEAVPDKCSAVSTSKLQHHGLPALITTADKYSYPIREQPVKLYGEDEVRLMIATIGPEATADLLDQSNNPEVHKAILRNILEADKPTAIKRVIDRQKYPIGNSRPLAFVNHRLACAGVELVYEEYDHETEDV